MLELSTIRGEWILKEYQNVIFIAALTLSRCEHVVYSRFLFHWFEILAFFVA